MNIIAQTKRLILRQFEIGDLDDLYRIYRSGDVRRFIEPMSDDYETEKEKLASYIYYMYGFYGFGLFAVCKKNSGKLIGRCGVWMTELDGEPEMEIGYMIESDEQRKGYGLESVMAVIDFAMEETDAKRLIARIHKDNQASQALALKAGFIKGDALASDYQMDLYTYELIRSNDGSYQV